MDQTEKSYLSAIVFSKKKVFLTLEKSELSEKAYLILRAIKTCHDADAFGISAVASCLQASGDLKKVGTSTLVELCEDYSQGSPDFFAGLIRKQHAKAQIASLANELSSDTSRAPEIRDKLNAAISGFSDKKARLVSDSLKNTSVSLRRAMFSSDGITGLRTGIRKLDDITTGLHSGELVVLAGRPSMGKTAMALTMALDMALNQKKRVVFVSLEMSNDSLAARIQCAVAKIDSNRYRKGRLSRTDFSKLSRANFLLKTCNLHLEDDPAMTIDDIESVCLEAGDVDALFVDYLQLMRPRSESGTREQDVAAMSRGLKMISKRIGVPVIALSQLSRNLEKRDDKRPIMSDLRESGAIEQDADLILFLYRPCVYSSEANQSEAEVIIGKQRNGPLGTVDCRFLSEFNRFVD